MTDRGKRRDERKSGQERAVTHVKCETSRCDGSRVFSSKHS